MSAPTHLLPIPLGWLLLVAPCLLPSAKAEAPLPLAVRDGRCEVVLPTERADAQFYLIIGSLARGRDPQRVTVETAGTVGPVALPVEPPGEDRAWAVWARDLAGRLAQARVRQPAPEPTRPA